MNRFFRSALFPLIIIVLLVYLASQTLLPGRSQTTKLTLSQLIAFLHFEVRVLAGLRALGGS